VCHVCREPCVSCVSWLTSSPCAVALSFVWSFRTSRSS
jgi:hypothetical protein